MRNATSNATPGPKSPAMGIFLISVVGLFLELLLIRWVSTEVRIFAYLQNTVLIVCFFGLGVGCFTSRQTIVIRHSLIAIMTLSCILAIPFTRNIFAKITSFLSVLDDFLIWEEGVTDGIWSTISGVTIGLALTFMLMILIWETFLPLGRILGRLMDDHPNTIWAYSLNVLGSLVGIWTFMTLGALSMPPEVWILCAAIALLPFLGHGVVRWANVSILLFTICAVTLGTLSKPGIECVWSPYQKLELYENTDPTYAWKGRYVIDVNNVGYQGMVDLSAEAVATNQMPAMNQYDLPLLFKNRPENVLIVGAGSGNDVAGALRGGAKQITAVDIDPVIIEMGRRYHPEQPYNSEQVVVVNDDARSFFSRTREKYDLIIFGLLDSHTMTSMTNARLDHYVYTRESLAQVRDLLKDGGLISMNFMAHRTYIADRINRTLTEVFGHPPLMFKRPTDLTGWGGVLFLIGDEQVISSALEENPLLSRQVASWQREFPLTLSGQTRVATDDWPYLYLERPSIPLIHFLMAGMLLCLLPYSRFRCRTLISIGKWRTTHWHFFFLGAAFLLLEVHNISKASVVLGNTWLVNAVIISGIMIMVLLANLITARWPSPTLLVSVALVSVCIALYFIDLAKFAHLPLVAKATIIGLLTSLPMLFSGLLFIDSFSQCENKAIALGANLVGALFGAILQTLTFALGIKALLLVVAALYFIAVSLRFIDLKQGNTGPLRQ